MSKKVAIIGAGIAGCSTAFSLAKRGWQVTLIEQNNQIATQASGALQSVLYLRLANQLTSKLFIHGYYYSLKITQELMAKQYGRNWHTPGIIQTAYSSAEIKRQQIILASGYSENLLHEINHFAIPKVISRLAIHFPQGGWINIPSLCSAMINHHPIELLTNHQLISLQQKKSKWQLQFNNQPTLFTDIVIIANSYQALSLPQTAHLPLKKVRGQVSYLPATSDSKKLVKIITGKSYICPAINNFHTIGSTHQFNDNDCSVRLSDHQQNLHKLSCNFPAIYSAINGNYLLPNNLHGHTGFRSSTPDNLPLIGPVADILISLEIWKKNKHKHPPVIHFPRLYVNVGHGYRGLITAPLSAEILATIINNEKLPIAHELALSCHADRFISKWLK